MLNLNLKSVLCLLLLAIVLASCAKKFYRIDPSEASYTSTNKELEINVFPDILDTDKNQIYYHKARSEGIEILGVEIINRSEDDLVFNQNTFIYQGIDQVNLLKPLEVTSFVNQNKASYMWYLLLGLVSATIEINSFAAGLPIGLGVGLLITIRNYRRANHANQDFLKNLLDYDLNGLLIRPGETRYAIIAYRPINDQELVLKKVIVE